MAEAVPECFTYYVPRLVPLLLASLDAPRVSEWASTSSQVINNSESAVADSKRLELVLRSIRSLKGILTEYLHLLIPSLVKLVDTISNSNNSLVAENGNYGGEGDPVRANIAVLTLETLSTVIAGDSCLPGKSSSVSNAAVYASQADASQQIPARAAQPLIRILGRKPHPSRRVGTAIVETLCVCAIRLGREQWVFYYHSPARNAILLWQEWVSPSASTSPTSIVDERWKWSGGVTFYDNLTESLLQKNGNVDSIVLIGKNGRLQEADRQYDRLKRPDDSIISDDEGRNVDSESGIFGNAHGPLPPIQPVNQASTFRVNQVHLQRAWDVSQRTTREDWDEWIRRFSVQLLRESPNAALRAAAGLAHAFPSLGRELFCAAFLCCWVELSDQYQKNLVQSLEVVFASNDVSPEILQALLNLCEVSLSLLSPRLYCNPDESSLIFVRKILLLFKFMGRHFLDEGGLRIDIFVLSQLALKCRAYAKALHYKEQEHKEGKNRSCVEALISINKKLDLPVSHCLDNLHIPFQTSKSLRHSQSFSFQFSIRFC